MTAPARRHLLAGLALATATLPHAGKVQSLPPDGETDRAESLEFLDDVAGRGQGATPEEWGTLQRTDDHCQGTDE